MANEIAARPPIAVRRAKAAGNKTFETSLSDGLDYERRLFYFLFAPEDQTEGMRAFSEKRQAEWARPLGFTPFSSSTIIIAPNG